jgi:hypothetical protein
MPAIVEATATADAASDPTTVVICRRTQLHAAASVLACAPPGRIWPLIVLDPPPIDEAEYHRRFEAYIAARDARDLTPNAASIARTDAAFETLTAYRWWAKQQRAAGEMIRANGIRRIAVLFDPPYNEFNPTETTPLLKEIGPERRPVFADSVARIDLAIAQTSTDLGAVADAAWIALRGTTSPAQPPLRAPKADCATAFRALAQALRSGRRLVFDDSAPPIGNGTTDDAVNGMNADEAVLIEAADDARRLLGVLYAARRRARLIVFPQPDLAAIEAARAAIQSSLRRSAVGDAAPKGFWPGFRPLTTAPAPLSPVDTFRAAVTAAVPAAVIAAVGERDLTAFTAGLPYNAVAAPDADWSSKPIGHIPDDAALLVLAHLLDAPPSFEVSFNLIFDPGYFTTDETQNVLDELQARVSPPLVLDGWSATILALERLSFDLPLDIIFFNTHGADDGIVLAGATLQEAIVPSYKLVREELPSRPLIFNNSCQSWTGVGREFVLTGARGYIGSLWSIDAGDAATYAKVVLNRVVQTSCTIARAMRGTGIRGFTELAYIFVGTASDALTAQTAADTNTVRIRFLQASGLLRDSIVRWLESEAGNNPSLPAVVPFVEVLWANAMRLYDAYARRTNVADPAAVDARIDQLEVGSRIVRQLGRGPDLATLHAQARELAEATPADDRTRARWIEALSRWEGASLRSAGQFAPAVAAYRNAIAAAGVAGHSAAKLWIELSDVCLSGGDAKGALDAAHAAEREPLSEPTTDPRQQRMLIVARLGSASLALNDFNAANAYAAQGAGLADALDDRSEQSQFMIDQSRAYLTGGDRAHAAQSAQQAYNLAALAYDPARATAARALYDRATATIPVVSADIAPTQTSQKPVT